jgi:DNA-binding CsgD family transcriptional regulator/tetratricopeptide (TPR) repeat protein
MTGAGLWEREAVTAAVERALDAARAGRGSVLGILAEAGLGKTTLVERTCRRAGADFRIGRTGGHALGAGVAFGLVGQAFDELGGHELTQALTSARLDRQLAPAEVRAQRFQATLRWLEETSGGPTLIALDDLHWADADSLALLDFAARRLARRPIVFLLAYRPWPVAAARLVAELAQDGHATVESLAPLSRETATALLAARVGRPIEDDLAGRAWELCGGNPLLLEQVALAIARGDEVPVRGHSTQQRISDELMLGRFAGLPEVGLRYVQAASVLGDVFYPEIAAGLAQLGDAEVELALEALLRGGLLRSARGRCLEFVHPLFAQALRDDIPPALRAQLHRRAFALLLAAGQRTLAAEHALSGALVGDARAIELLEETGRRELAAGALATATRHLEAAADHAGDHASPSLLLALGDALVAVGRSADAAGVFERALAHRDLDARARARTLRLLGRALFVTRQHARAAACFEEAERLGRTTGADDQVHALLDHALASWVTAGPRTALPLAERAVALVRDDERALQARARSARGFFTLLSGDPAGFEMARTAADAVLADPAALRADLAWAWGAVVNFGHAATYTERFAEAEDAFRTGLRAAERAGATEAFVSLALGYVNALVRLGRLTDALAQVQRASEAAAPIPVPRPFLALAQATVLSALGRSAEAETWYRRAESIALGRGERLVLIRLWHVLGQKQLRDGHWDDASRTYLRLEEVARGLGLDEPCVVPWAQHAIWAHVACSAPADAQRVLVWLERRAARLPCGWPRLAAALGRAQLAAARDDHAGARAHFETALDLSAAPALPLRRAEALLAYGAYLRRRGEANRARALLGEALRLAETCGAGPLAAQVRPELDAAGGRRRRRGTPARLGQRRWVIQRGPAVEALTPQELRVARLAASGLANREIASRVVLSVRTVETHLQRAYGKLGIGSRRQLIAMGAAGELPELEAKAQ